MAEQKLGVIMRIITFKRLLSMSFLLLAFLAFSANLSAKEDWVESVRQDLEDSGYSSAEIEQILKQERARRAKKSGKKEPAKAAAVDDNDDDEEDEEEVEKKIDPKARLAEIEAEQRDILSEEKDLEGAALDRILRLVMAVEKKLLPFEDSDDYDDKMEELYRDSAEKRVRSSKATSSSKHGKQRSKRYSLELVEQWEDWYYIDTKKTKSKLEKLIKVLVKDELEDRAKRAKAVRDEVLKECSIMHFTFQRGGRGGGGGRGGRGGIGEWARAAMLAKRTNMLKIYWDKQIAVLTEKDYAKEKKNSIKTMKKNAISKEIQKVFYKGLDPFIDDKYDPSEDEDDE
jgi:hypothetical protein